MNEDSLKFRDPDYSKRIMEDIQAGSSFYDACKRLLPKGDDAPDDNRAGLKELWGLVSRVDDTDEDKNAGLYESLHGVSKLKSAYKQAKEEHAFAREKWYRILVENRRRRAEIDSKELSHIRNMGYSLHQQCHLLYNLFVARGISERTARALVKEICGLECEN